MYLSDIALRYWMVQNSMMVANQTTTKTL